MEILIPILVLLATGVLCAVLLTLASVFFGVKENENVAKVRDCLPGANCGACGYSGCDGYAQALGNGLTDKTNLCIPGGDSAAREIAAVLGVEAQDVVEMVAYVACNGDCAKEKRKYEYDGPATCRAANMSFSGDRNCTFACLGYGDCMRVCPSNAISINDRGVAEVNSIKCIGCGMCARTCPDGIIKMVKDTTRVVVLCSNHQKGAEVRKICTDGCIGCGKCQKNCPTEAIKVVDNLATIDYDLCIACGKCAEVCPTHCIHEGNFICGTHFK